jgi:small-conductance mechanosensitive channel
MQATIAGKSQGEDIVFPGIPTPKPVRRTAAPLALLVLACWLTPGHAQPAAAQEDPVTYEPAELVITNRLITTLRAPVYGASPAERVEAIQDNLEVMLQRGGPLLVTTRPIPEGVAVLVDGKFLLRVLDDDVHRESGETAAMAATAAADNLKLAIEGIRESRDSKAMLSAVGYTILVTAALVVLLWLLARGYAVVARRIQQLVARRSDKLTPAWSRPIVGQSGLAALAILPVRLAAWAAALLLTYEWAALVLTFFPYTRPWGEGLFDNLLDALGRIGGGILDALPGLLFVALIFLITRFVVRIVRAFFESVQSGRVQVSWIDETTARPTGRLLTAIIWLFSLVAAYPYIPGSDSEAFKGIGVFVGLMLSIGASGVVNQAVSGMMLMYTKALRPGEFVQVGDTEGTVTSVGFLTTRIETLRNVEVTLPNAYLVGNETRNLSRLAANGGIRVATAVTIGYDTPWRQVQAMLQMAAGRTAKVSQDPPPRVLQTALKDFYVEYTLIVATPQPRDRFVVLDELHGHIQDVFNEFGVQIMSPNYEADPADKKFVPQDQWYTAPAKPVSAPQGGGGDAGR